MKSGREDRAAYVMGLGVVRPIAIGRKAFWSSLLANESGVGPITLFDPDGFDIKMAAECNDFDPKDFMDQKVAQRTDRFVQMALASAKLALEGAGAWSFLEESLQRVGLLVGTDLGGTTSIVRTQWEMDNKGSNRVTPSP